MQQILCTAAKHALLYSKSVASNVSIQRGCLHGYWLYNQKVVITCSFEEGTVQV